MKSFGKQNKCLVLCYHNVGSREGMRHLETSALTVTPEQFRSHMKWLTRFFDFVDPGKILAGKATQALPARPVILTFDDATSGILRHAAPVLAEFGIRALAFASIEHHKDPSPYWWDLADRAYEPKTGFGEFLALHKSMGAMAAARLLKRHVEGVAADRLPMSVDSLRQWTELGHYVASHGMTHDPASTWKCERDCGAKELFDAVSGRGFINVAAFAYGDTPAEASGGRGAYELLDRAGIKCVFGTGAGFFSLDDLDGSVKASAPLPRLIVPSQWCVSRLLVKIVRIS